ncbi:EmrB/QacA subfamily drug resistance transporter [Actinoalloteichus hoggarensis]|uniref:Putative MFS-type transporter EfpA n=1 Tax=Actinoalloteichus hoggarensis TaxID=1470176 RepID=A0A221W742_9PSEU|nr:MFS transporter [Actinoalloteichus hoggarensis]ASO21762.1 putative MFS-type transporter EfpA [Actinoalloteichus hoggarensis]MBB5922359.1 EmrB/QacA subfamily drug resistance transporter [Actinoalloteichus hoggarensis]
MNVPIVDPGQTGTGADQRAARRALILLACTQFLLLLDTSIINVAVPSIGDELDIGAADLPWIANAYLVTFGGLLLLSGRAADLVSRRGLFVTGLVVLVIGSAAGALAGDAGWLIAARAAQGVGAALAASAAFALLLSLFPDGPARHRALGLFAAMAGVGGAAGTVLGGVLTSWLGWRSTFVLSVLAGAVLAAAAVRMPRVDRAPGRGARFGVTAALSSTAALGSTAYALVNTGVHGWTAPSTLAPAAAAVALLIVFVIAERRAETPLVPPTLLRRRAVITANLLACLAQFAYFPMFFLVSVYLQTVLGYSAVLGGLGLLPLSLTVVLVAAGTGRLIGRYGVRAVLIAGWLLTAAGLGWLALLSVDGSFAADVLPPSLLLGVALPLVTVTSSVAATAQARPAEIGLASGLINTSQQFGAVLGLAVLSGVATARTLAVGGPADPAALTNGFAVAFLVAAVLAVLAACYALTLRTGAPHGDESTPGPAPTS